jgi:leucyl aminopeptidase
MLFKYVIGASKNTNVPLVVVLGKETVDNLDLLPDTYNASLIKSHAKSLLSSKDLKEGSSVEFSIMDESRLLRVAFVMPDPDSKKAITELSKNVGKYVKNFLGNSKEVQVFLTQPSNEFGVPEVPTLARGISNELYDFKDSIKKPEEKTVYIINKATPEMDLDIKLHNSMVMVRDLVTSPPNTLVPQTLVAEAKKLVGKKIKMIEHVPANENMAGLLAVGRGSSLDSEFIELHYKGNKKSDIDFVFIGKGITFDSGGYSLKPAKSMETMKGDMAGAATVLGLFRYLKEHGSELNIVGLIPTCENMIGKDAIVPGEVITYSNGKTVEVLNTDAEGRLILADALIYSEKFKDAKVIDIATLTGGIIVGLGNYRTGLFSDDKELVELISETGAKMADPVWHMPMDEEVYSPKSEVADMKNISSGPSSITAALFLKAFAPGRWAHLDIAGTSGEAVGTGRPLPLLIGLVSGK